MNHNEDIITADAAGTLDGLLRTRIKRSPDAIAYRQFNKAAGEWRDLAWSHIGEQVSRWQQAIAATDLHSGDRVALLMRNGTEWVIAEQACLGLGLVIVPLYCDDRPDNIAYILNDSATRMLIANDAIWRRVHSACNEVESLDHVIIVPVDAEVKNVEESGKVRFAANWIAASPAELRSHDRKPGELATIVYTSGTTGKPKGVMLSHSNILSIAHAALVTYDVYTDDLFLSFLPLSHTFERTVGYFLPMMAGCTVAYARSIAQLGDDMLQIKPTALVAVPRIFERVHGKIMQQLEKKSFIARGLFRLTTMLGWWRFESQQRRGNILKTLFAMLLLPLLDPVVAKKVRAKMGGRLRLAVSGGAALPFPVAKSMIGLGVTITQGYGLTETSPVICGNPLDDNDPASVGVALKGIEVRIGEDEELQVRTPGLMLGYWNNHAATAEVIEPDGWFHTGDQARIENNHIYITGRLKDILVLSNGEKVPPGDMEAAISIEPLIEQVMVIGEGQSFLSALVVLNPEEWIAIANKFVIDPYEKSSLDDPRIHNHLLGVMRKALVAFPSYAKIRKVIPSLEQWTVENGLLTPTLKVKRNKVIELNQSAIDNTYS